MRLELTFDYRKALKVYRWTNTNSSCPPANNGSRQCEHVCAARSVAELSRISGLSPHFHRTWGGVTGNKESIAVAMAEPGVIFWQAEHWQGKPGPKQWQRIEPKP